MSGRMRAAIDGDQLHLHHDGVIGKNGVVSEINVRLGDTPDFY